MGGKLPKLLEDAKTNSYLKKRAEAFDQHGLPPSLNQKSCDSLVETRNQLAAKLGILSHTSTTTAEKELARLKASIQMQMPNNLAN